MTPHQCHPANEELLGLLRELGRDADTAFGQRLASKDAVLPLQWPPPPRRRDRSAARLEEHLVKVHREELGALLKDACLRLLVTNEKLGGKVVLNKVDGIALEPKLHSEWSQDCKIKRRTFPDPAGSEAEMLVLDRLLRPAMGGAPSLRAVAEAGLRLAPSTAFEIYRGRGLEEEGDLTTAGRVLERACAESSQYMNRLVAACSRGVLAFETGDFLTALEWWEIAATGRAPYPPGALGWLFAAIQTGQEGIFSAAANNLPDHLKEDDSILHTFCLRKRAERLAGVWKPSAAARSLFASSEINEHVEQVLQLFR